jgi:hypothetical protein
MSYGSKRNLAKLAKIKIKTLPLVRRDGACTFGKVVLEVEEPIQETLKLVEFTDVYAVRELVEKFDKRYKPLDSGFDLGLEDFDTIFALNFLEVD